MDKQTPPPLIKNSPCNLFPECFTVSAADFEPGTAVKAVQYATIVCYRYLIILLVIRPAAPHLVAIRLPLFTILVLFLNMTIVCNSYEDHRHHFTS